MAGEKANRFERALQSFAHRSTQWTGTSWAFLLAVMVVLVWAATGPIFGFTDTWQLVINTGTTIITFLMVFLIQSTQNSDTEAIQVKLDELIRATQGAHNALLGLEDLDSDALEDFHKKYAALAEEARKELKKGLCDTGTPDA